MTPRRAVPQDVKRIVIKVGTRLLSDSDFKLDRAQLGVVVENVNDARAKGIEVVLVTSGAVAAGMGAIGFATRPAALIEKQACAAVGQSLLMQEYQTAFADSDVLIAQVLLTRSEVISRKTHQTIRGTLDHLLGRGILPIVNENDVVSADELKFGDNDTLSGLVADLIAAELLVILTDVEGLFVDEGGTRKRLSVVPSITDDIRRAAGGAGSKGSVGGMITKIETAERMGRAGRATVIASGRSRSTVRKILAGEDVGTLFLPSGKKVASRKRWIADHLRSVGRIAIDAGAARALRQRGGSLLPIGVTGVEGLFGRGAAVEVVDEAGRRVGQGLAAYSSVDIERIKGGQSREIAVRLGYSHGEEVIHRNDLVVSG